tara:strand:+ start:1843 stop:2076 length:234 start_codon:yes stop_codon:yes gene_type:complete
MKSLFNVDHFVPFPQSEYGGLWCVIAENDEECFTLISDYDDGLNSNYYSKLRENIVKAPRFSIADEVESEVVASFLT